MNDPNHEKHHPESNPKLKRLVKVQLVVAAIAAILTIVVSSQIYPLLQRKAQLEKEVVTLEEKINEQKKEIDAYITQLNKTRKQSEMMRQGLIDLQSRQYTDAIKEFDIAIELDPLNPNAYNLKGYAQLRHGDVLGAIETLKRSIEVDPNYVWGHYNLALAYWARGDYSMAIKEVERVVEIKPEFREVLKKDGQFNKFREFPEYRNIVG